MKRNVMEGLTPRLGAQLPLQLPLRDTDGRAVRLGDYFGAVPVLLVLGYYRCRNVCSMVFEDVLQALQQSGTSAWRLLGVSINPAEGPADAAPRQAAYRAWLGERGGQVSLATGDAAAIAALAQSIGFTYRYNAELQQYLHPAGFVVLTPGGRVSRCFTGLRYRPEELRGALAEAAGAGVGAGADVRERVGLVEQVALWCGQREGEAASHGAAAWRAMRLTGAGSAALLALLLLRLRSRRGRGR